MTAPRPIAVALDGDPTPAWQQRALENMRLAPSLEVVEVRLVGPPAPDSQGRLLGALERRMFGLGEGALAPTGVAATADGAGAAIGASPQPPADPPATAPLLVWLSERPPPAPREGQVVSLRHAHCPQPPARAVDRAIIDRAPFIESEVLLAGERGALVVDRTVSGVRTFSRMLTRNLMLWKLAALVPRALERLPGLDLPAPAAIEIPPAPARPQLAMRALLSWSRVLATRLLFHRRWSISVRARAGHATEGWLQEQALVAFAAGHLYADPFLFELDGRHHLFCEEIEHGGEPGVISHTVLTPGGGPAPQPVAVLRRPYHLSYPFVFERERDIWMIPETSEAGRVELYRAVDFPHEWEREAVLLEDVDAVDATILDHDGRLWMFVVVAAPDASLLDELHLFSARELRGPWRAHPRNPVVSDVRCARPAGAIQRWEGRLVRPGQDGSRRYGGSVSFREIDVLSERDYAEHEIARIDPSDVRGARATHTYTADSRFEAIDLRRRERRM